MKSRSFATRCLALTAFVALTSGLTSCYPDLYEETDSYLKHIEHAQEGVGHHGGGEHASAEHGDTHGDAGHGDDAAHGEATHGDDATHGEAADHSADTSHDTSHEAPADAHGIEGH